MARYIPPRYPYVRPAELAGAGPARTQVAIVGAGPVGLACAIDLAQQGIEFIIIDDNDTVSTGSRAICYAKRALEILDRLGCGDRICEKGVSWKVGKVFRGDSLAYQFDLLPEPGHKRPAFVNLQQYHLEEVLVDQLSALGRTVRWKHRVVGVEQNDQRARLAVETPDGLYSIDADYLIAADGAKSTVRDCLGLEWRGQVFRDRFLIADVHMQGDYPTERWFWFDPPFHPGQSALLHRQADDIWRIDFQLGWEADPEEERRPERVIPRIRAMLGPDRPFDLEWSSVYTFQCRRLDRFVHGRVLFAGDSAHQVSPFGARGANSGFQDADNLCWKLARVVRSQSPPQLLATYDSERGEAADENIRHSTRATDFITPKSEGSRVLRDAVLTLAPDWPFARKLVNSGRLSTPITHRSSTLSSPDCSGFDGSMSPGTPAADAPVAIGGRRSWLLDQLGGRFDLVIFASADSQAIAQLQESTDADVRITAIATRPDSSLEARVRTMIDLEGLAMQRYDAQPGTTYLFRPDQLVAARWRSPTSSQISEALVRAQGL